MTVADLLLSQRGRGPKAMLEAASFGLGVRDSDARLTDRTSACDARRGVLSSPEKKERKSARADSAKDGCEPGS